MVDKFASVTILCKEMATRKRRTVTLLRIVEEETFDDTEPPSLSGVAIETTCEEAPAPLAKTTAERWPWYRAAGGSSK